MTKFVCISGRARHGKDTTATLLKKNLSEKGYTSVVVHYADLLKHICKAFFGWNGEKDEQGRSLLQRVGTECVRTQNPNYWVDFVISLAALFPAEYDYIIVPDARFPNEISRIREAGFDVTHVRVVRDGFKNELTPEQQLHASETALDGTEPDYWVHNRDMDDLCLQVKNLCDMITKAPADTEALHESP